MSKSFYSGRKLCFSKKKQGDKIWQVDFIPRQIGTKAISFDKKRILFLFRDYPIKFTPEQKELFDKENPYWAKFFKSKNLQFATAQKISVFKSRKTLEACLKYAKDNYYPNDPMSCLYRRIISYKLKDKFSDEFLGLLYVALRAWNMDSKLEKLKPFPIFVESIKKHQADFEKMRRYKIENFDEVDPGEYEVGEIFEDLFYDLELVDSKTPIVMISKVLHLMLPDLIVPIDREFTMQFFYGKKNKCSSIMKEPFRIFWELETIFSEFVKRNDVSHYIDNVWNLNIPKILDNAIIGKVLQDAK